MKILVTGSAGFIGFHVSKALLERGDTVVGLDNFNAYYDVALKELRAKTLSSFSSFTMVRADLSNTQTIADLFAKEKFDAVCNLAAQAGVRWSIEHPFDYITSNITGFLSILEACRHNKVPRLVYASSSSVYGGNEKLPFSEDDRVDNPISLYAATKKSNELMAHCYSHLYGFQTIGLRFFTVYGPFGRPDMAMWLFADAIRSNKPISVFNHGKMQRDFTYINDIVSGILSALTVSGLEQYEVFNLGNNNSEDLMRVIDILENSFGKKTEKILLPMQPGDVAATFADISHAEKKLGFKPQTPIDIGIPHFITWYKLYHKL